MTAVRLGVTPLVTLDCETTGLSPSRDRIVEIAIVRLAPDGTIIDSWESLVNPQRDPGPVHVHGLTSADLEDAPVFADVADEVAERLAGAVVAAQNVNFDSNFLRYEFDRLDRPVPQWPCLDTVRAAYRLGLIPRGARRRLGDLCARVGISHVESHRAINDAMSTAHLVGAYLQVAADGGFDFEDLGVQPLYLPSDREVRA